MIIQSRFFEDYKVGQSRQTIGRTITETDVVIHAGQTGDFFPHHMDAHWCKTQPFGQRIAHGTLIFSIAIGMTASEINPEAMSKGYDRLRFIKPVFIGDTISVTITVAACGDAKQADYGVVTEQVEVKNNRNEMVLVCAHLLMVKRKKTASSFPGSDDLKAGLSPA